MNFTFDNFIPFEYFSLIICKKIKFITPVETNIEISFNTVDSYFACSQRQCIQKRCVHCRSVVYVDWLGWWLTDSYLYTMSEIDRCVTLSKRTGKNVSNRLYIPNARNRHKKPFLIFFFLSQIVFFCPSMNKYVHTWNNKRLSCSHALRIWV